MSWIAVGGAAVGIVGDVLASNASSDAADSAAQAQTNAANQANATQLQIYNQNTANAKPFMDTGVAANNQLAALMGLNGQAPDFSVLTNSPTYQFAKQQGMAGMDASAASHGNLFSGGYGKQLVGFNQGLASQQFNNYYNQLAGLSGTGLSASNALAGVGTNYANQVGQNDTNAGMATASGYLQNGQANANLYNGLGQIAGNFASSYQPGFTPGTAAMQINPGQPNGSFNFGSVPNVQVDNPLYQVGG